MSSKKSHVQERNFVMSIRLGEDLDLVQINVDDGTLLMINESFMIFFLNFFVFFFYKYIKYCPLCYIFGDYFSVVNYKKVIYV